MEGEEEREGQSTQKEHQEDREAEHNLVEVKTTGNLVLLEPKGRAAEKGRRCGLTFGKAPGRDVVRWAKHLNFTSRWRITILEFPISK